MANQIASEFERWRANVSPRHRQELDEMPAAALEDAFYRELAFGTGGLRGVLGLGPNRMNVYTVAKATQGLANYLNGRFERPEVAIARDSRLLGQEFAETAAGVLAANGIRAHLYPRIETSSDVCFEVIEIGCLG